MKRSVLAGVCLVAFASLSWTQTVPPSDHSHAHAQHQEHTDSSKQMMAQHAADMKATAQALTTNLAQMKATLPLINDINERSRWQSNIAMWQAVTDHFNEMAKRAEHMQAMDMGCGMMTGHSMGDHAEHEHTQPANPAKTQ